MGHGVVCLTPDGKILTANPSAERMLGIPLSNLEGRALTDPVWKIIHEDSPLFVESQHPGWSTWW